MPKVRKSVRLKWPVGPLYFRRAGGKNPHAWAGLKMRSADWYLDALATTMREAGDLERYVGIEMALDGALASMCAAVDAAGSGLADKFIRTARLPTAENETSTARWRSVYSFASAVGVTLPSEYAVSEAFAGFASSEPTGWFSQLAALRDRAVRHNVLVRRTSIGGDFRGRFLDVPGVGPREPIEYLESMREKVNQIVELLVADIDLIPKLLAAKTDAERSHRPKQRALPDLLSRARVLTPSDRNGGAPESDKAVSPVTLLLSGNVLELIEQLDERRLSRFTRFHEQVLHRLGGEVNSNEWALSEPSVAELVDLAIERVTQVRIDDAVDLLAAVVADSVLRSPSPERIERHNTFLGFVGGLREAHIRLLEALGEARAAFDSAVRSRQVEFPSRATERLATILPDLAAALDSIAAELTEAGLVKPARENGMTVVGESIGDPFLKRIELSDYGAWIIEQLRGPFVVADRRILDRIASPKD